MIRSNYHGRTMDYYNREILIPAVDQQNTILNPVERHEAHQKGILHRGFTIGVFFEDKLICQHRKHPLFNDCLDLTASSHPMYQNGNLLDSAEMLLITLEREWGIQESDLLSPLEFIGRTYYRSEDVEFIEHEICEVFTTSVQTRPTYNPQYAYGFYLLTPEDLKEQKDPKIAPWVVSFLESGLF